MAVARGSKEVAELAKKYGGGGKWLSKKLTDDEDYVIGAFIGDAVAVEAVWDRRANRNVNFDETRHDPEKAQLHILWNFYDRDDKTVYIWDKGTKFFGDWNKKKHKKGMKRWWRLRRDGEAGDTKTKYKLIDEGPIDDDDWEALKKLEQHDLPKTFDERDDDDDNDRDNDRFGRRNRRDSKKKKKKKKKDKGKDRSREETAQSNGQISASVAKKLLSQLKGLPGDALPAFYKRFKIKKMKKLPADELSDARKFIENMSWDEEGNEDRKQERDPFVKK